MGNFKVLKHAPSLLRIIPILLGFLCIKNSSYAQQPGLGPMGGNYSLSVGRMPMSKGVKDAVTAEISETDPEVAREEWKKFVKSYRGKTKANKSEIVSSNAELSGRKANIFALFAPSSVGTRVSVFLQDAETKDFILLTENQERYRDVALMLESFAKSAQRAGVNRQKETQEKLLKSLESEYKKLTKNTEELRKDIEEYKNKITKAEEQIVRNEKEIKRKKEEIIKQEQTIEYVKEKLGKVPR